MERTIDSATDTEPGPGITHGGDGGPGDAGIGARVGSGAGSGFGGGWDNNPARSRYFALGKLDLRSLLYALVAAMCFFALGLFCLSISRFDSALASVWLPNAAGVAILLRAQLRNEVPIFAVMAAASMAANMAAGNPVAISLAYTIANMVDIALVTWLMRRSCGLRPDMANLAHLGRFLQYGGLIGPLVSASLAAIVMGPGQDAIWSGASSWFLADSLGMVLTVPAVLLSADAVQRKSPVEAFRWPERAALMLGGLAAVFLVFAQDNYPLLFVIPPITLLVALRVGGLGTALYVPAIAIIASWMTFSGFGPIVQMSGAENTKMYLIQGFVAANFLTGLPIAALLAGREKLMTQLERGQLQLELLADNITDAVMRYDLGGRCTFASSSVRQVLGVEPASLIGKPMSDRSHEDARERIALAQERLATGASDHERFTYRRALDGPQGTPVFIEAQCANVFDPVTGERDGIVISARDVTERVELELLLTRARRSAENAARAKSEFLANMSHEIRTPMNGVLGFAELMLQGELDEEQERHTEMIVQSGRSMMLLLNDILDLSKIEAGQIAIDHAPVDLHSTLAECAALHRPVAEKKGLSLTFERQDEDGTPINAAPDERPWVMTDALRLRQIVLNLVGNAVKFTERGHVEVVYWADDVQYCVEVRDTGIGISPSRIETIFSPFTQGESDTARRFGGTGLGLTISRQLAELLGGFIDVESEPGEGSCFRLTLPARYAAPGQRAPEETDAIEPEDLPRDARILLAEDHDVNRMLGTEMLERCGQSVAIAHDGNEAIAMVIDSVMRGKPFDLVLMDIQMPGCDGYAATRAIRADGIDAEMMPIIALTANAFPEDIAAARDAGMQAHLSKPLIFADLARALQRWLPTRIIDAAEALESAGDDPAPIGAQGQSAYQTSEVVDAHTIDPALVLFGDGTGNSGAAETEAPTGASGLDEDGSLLDEASALPGASSIRHSPSLISRWTRRRSEAVEAVRDALQSGDLGDGSLDEHLREELARLVHKLAGTAAIFGEPELGDQAAAFERSLRMGMSGEVQEALAFELLSVADDPADSLASG